MKSKASTFCGGALALMLALMGLAGPATAKSLYVIASQDSEYASRIQAYNVNADGTLTYQATYTPAGNSTVGLALDNASNTLFVSTEGSGYLTVIDAKTMTSLGAPVLAPGAYDLAGIVMDESKQLLYTVDRGTDQLYVYKWDASAKTLSLQPGSPHTLAGVSANYGGAYGIAVDKVNNLLFVANATDTIFKFNTSDWSPAGTLRDSNNPDVAISIAFDSRNQLLYTGAAWYGDPYLKQYSLTYGSTSRVQITGLSGVVDGVIGLDVDENTGYIYISTTSLTNELQVFNSELTKIQTPDLTGHTLNGPAGLVIGAGYNLLNLSKTASPAYPTSVQAGRNVTYTITCDNVANTQPVTNVIIRDNLPADTTFISATGGGVYDSPYHAVTWNLGTMPAGDPPRSFQLVAQVKPGTPAKIIVNNATISSAETPPSTQSAQTSVTAALAWGIAFPLPAYTAFTAPVSAVMDNSVLERTPIQFYATPPADVIKAFNGEIGDKQYGVKYMDPSGLYWPAYKKDSAGTNFFPPSAAGVRPLNYINGPYLSYAGMPGYNYQVPAGSPVMATADGKLYKPDTDPVNGTPSYYNTSYIDHQNGWYSWYLYAPLSQAILAQISQNGYAQVTKGQIIGNTSGDHLHFEMRYNGIDHQNVVDPYKLGLWLPNTTHVEALMLLLFENTPVP